jgi:hypothetical protein
LKLIIVICLEMWVKWEIKAQTLRDLQHVCWLCEDVYV